MRNKRALAVIVAATIVAVLAGCGPTEAPTEAPAPPTEAAPTATPIPPTPIPEKPVTVVYGINTEPDVGMTPVFGGNHATYVAFELVFNQLVKLNDQLQPSPDLAETWDVSADNLVWTFHLADNVIWHDGTPFTAEDIKFTYETMLDPDVGSPFASNLEDVAAIEVVDDTTLQITLDKTFAPFLVKLADISIMPKHILEGVPDFKTSEFQRNPVGTGPFKLVEWQTGAFLRFEANEDYFKGAPAIDELVFKIVPDAEVLSVQLETGEVDIAEGVSPSAAKRMEENQDVDLVRHTAMRLRYLQLSHLNPLFQDKLVRQAMAHAIDREGIIATILEGYGERCITDYPPSSWVFNPDAKMYDYDPEAAKDLLSQAGWELGPDGVLTKDGKPFEFTMLVRAGDTQLEQTAIVIRDNLKAVGILAEIEALEATVLRTEHMFKRDFDAFLWGRGVWADPDYYVNWGTFAITDAYNFISYSNPDLDALFEQGRETLDTDKRKAIYGEIQEILAEEQPIIFLDWPFALNGFRTRVQGYSPEGTTPSTLMWNVHQWTVEE